MASFQRDPGLYVSPMKHGWLHTLMYFLSNFSFKQSCLLHSLVKQFPMHVGSPLWGTYAQVHLALYSKNLKRTDCAWKAKQNQIKPWFFSFKTVFDLAATHLLWIAATYGTAWAMQEESLQQRVWTEPFACSVSELLQESMSLIP